jgi:hypothetical protein
MEKVLWYGDKLPRKKKNLLLGLRAPASTPTMECPENTSFPPYKTPLTLDNVDMKVLYVGKAPGGGLSMA